MFSRPSACFLATILVVSVGSAMAGEQSLFSPDKTVLLTTVCADGSLSYTLRWNDRELLNAGRLELIPGACKLLDTETVPIDTLWQTVWGQQGLVRDACNQLTMKLNIAGVQASLIVRVYNDGVGFRFVVPEQELKTPINVNFFSEITPHASASGWYPNGEHEPTGPVPFGKGTQQLPALLDTGDGVFLGLLESDLFSATAFETAGLQEHSIVSAATLTSKGLVTPWRVILLGKQPGDLITSTVPINLAAPCQLEDTSWVKPGKALWDWRVHGYRAGTFQYDVNTESYLRFVDFCSKNKIRYFLIDDTWFQSVSNGRLMIKEDVDLNRIMAHARDRGVDILLYYDRKKGKSLGDAKLLKLYADFGGKGIKYGFMGDNAAFTRTTIKIAAANKLGINFHDSPCPMTGVRRTLPNALTREFCHAQQDRRAAFSPTTFLKMAMINALSGPLDMSNGAYGLDGINRGERVKGPKEMNTYNSTVVSETARTLVIFSGLIILPDAPEEYARKDDLFAFIREMPATWDESRIIHSKIGTYITTARRSGDAWFVGSVINEKGGTLSIPLDFLEGGKTYDVTYYEDAPDTHFETNREAYTIRKARVTSKDTVEARMAPGGGHCMWIREAR